MKILRFNDDLIGALKGEDHVVDISSLIGYSAERGFRFSRMHAAA